MIVHQHVGMQLAPGGKHGVMQQVQVANAVAIIKKAGQPVVAPMNDVLRDAGKIDARESSHADERDGRAPLPRSSSTATSDRKSARYIVGSQPDPVSPTQAGIGGATGPAIRSRAKGRGQGHSPCRLAMTRRNKPGQKKISGHLSISPVLNRRT